MAVKQLFILPLTMLLSFLVVSQTSPTELRGLGGNAEHQPGLPCCSTRDRGELLTRVEQFFTLSSGHVLAQVNQEKTGNDIKQPGNQEEDLGRRLIGLGQLLAFIFISEGAVGGLIGAFIIYLARHHGDGPIKFKAKSRWEVAKEMVNFHLGGIVFGAMSYGVMRMNDQAGEHWVNLNRRLLALIVGCVVGAGWPLLVPLLPGIAVDLFRRLKTSIMASMGAFFKEFFSQQPTTDAPDPQSVKSTGDDERPASEE